MISIIIGFVIFVFLELLYGFFKDKIKNISLKTERVILSVALIFGFITQIIDILIIKIEKEQWIAVINVVINLLNIILTYRIVKSKSNRENAIFSLIMWNIILPFVFIKNMCNNASIMILLILINLNILVKDLDYGVAFRKRNIFYFILISICSIIIVRLNYFLLPIIVFELCKLYKCMNRLYRNKVVLLNMFFIALGGAIYYVIEKYIFDISSLFQNIEITNYNFYIMYVSIIISIMLKFCLQLIKKKNSNSDIINLITLLYILVSTYIVNSSMYLFLAWVIIISYIEYQKLTLDIYIKQYKRPTNIKKVSVVIPNYNYANYIESRIDSVLKQTYPIYELIILDDKSKDNSIEVIEKKITEIEKKYPNVIIKFIPNKINSGNVFKQWAKSFEVSTGDYLWIAEADDLSNKYFLNTVMQGFDDENVIISYCESLAIDAQGKVFKKDLRDWIDIFNTGKWNKDYINDGKKELKDCMCVNNTIANVSSAVFNKNKKCDFAKYLKEAQNYTLAGDWYFYSKVLLSGDIAYSKPSLNYHRMHSSSVTLTTDNFVHYNEIISIQDSVKKDVELSDDELNKIETRRADLKRNFGINEEEIYYNNINLKKLIEENNIKDDILLSIIIPVYNTEKYLNKCLKSFMKFLPEKTEVIIINDGSPDNSEEIILDYAKKFKCIKYIKKDNGGLSSVKNRGLQEAKGRYITFLDSDDYVSSNMYSTMLKKAIDKSADLVYCDVLLVYEDGKVDYRNMTNYERENEDIMQHIDSGLMAASWNKIVKKELYDGISFPEKMNNEDVAVSPILFAKSKKTIKVESPFYKYIQRDGSIQNSGFNENRFVIFDTAKILFKNIKEYDLDIQEKIQGAVITHQLLAILMHLIMKIEDKQQRINFIKMFCEKYNDLKIFDENKYIDEFLNKYKIEKLLTYIKDNDIDNIDKYLIAKYNVYTKL